MLQQTQVATVIPFFGRWMARFPTVSQLATASEQEILSLWQGLGYYRRVRLLHEGARWVVNHGFPATAKEWRAVPGVGRYTAGAIASIASGELAPVVDGNVERVHARLTANGAVGNALHRDAWQWAEQELDREHPGDWNQALMELGALVCKPVQPLCDKCPIRDYCKAWKLGRVQDFPAKTPQANTVQLEHVVWAPIAGGKFGLDQIPEGKWWAGMWEFPRVKKADLESMRARFPSAEPRPLGKFSHRVTTHAIRVDAYSIELVDAEGLTWFEPAELEVLPMPAPQRKILKKLQAQQLGIPFSEHLPNAIR
jgi:A/G-specific adenine glycosylase